MGQEVERYHFNSRDFRNFESRLRSETELVARWFQDGLFRGGHPVGGIELELWLVDQDGRPAPENEAVLNACNDQRIVPELARFNIEINSTARVLHGKALSEIERELAQVLALCRAAAAEQGLNVVAVGVLPTVRDADLQLQNMSARSRYRALNEQILRLREGRPMLLDIRGRDHHLRTAHNDLMLEAAATSLQVHLQVAPELATRLYNVSKIVAGPMTALAANSPYLFEKDLWDETRIPLFEQAVAIESSTSHRRRVTFGSGYANGTLLSCFEENRVDYDIVLPIIFEEPDAAVAHLRLHNGTIWRWNRPLIGFDENGEPHLRIEHRVASAGPTMADATANAAFFFGLASHLLHAPGAKEKLLSFEDARQNFYEAARIGMDARIQWFGGSSVRADTLLLSELLPSAREGLERLDISHEDADHYIGILVRRVKRRRNGAEWQRAFVDKHGPNMTGLVLGYLERALSGAPVGEWNVL